MCTQIPILANIHNFKFYIAFLHPSWNLKDIKYLLNDKCIGNQIYFY